MAPVEESIRRLTQLSDELNTSTDSLNETFEMIGKRLASAEAGVEDWLPGLVAIRVQKNFEAEPKETEHHIGWQIGFARVNRKWQLCSRNVMIEYWSPPAGPGRFEALNGDHLEEGVDYRIVEAGAMPLINANRQVRIAAAEGLEALVDRLISRVGQQLDTIGRLRAVAIEESDDGE